MKIIYETTPIADLCLAYPELIDVLAQIGFHDIAHPLMRNSVGRYMTLVKGCKIKHIAKDTLIEVLLHNGFELIS